MNARTLVRSTVVAVAVGLVLSRGGSVFAQLQVTELMNNPLSADDNAWEWMEVRNLGATPVDLNGYLISRLGDEEFVTPGVNNAQATNTVIPAGGVAVIYDGQLTGAGDFNDSLFRTAWGLAPTVPLIAANNFGLGLTNGSGTAIGFWPDLGAYQMDLSNTDADPELEVSSLTNTAFSLDYRTTNMFPSVTQGSTIAWSGNGSYQDGTQWSVTTSGTTSVPATLVGSTNSPNDTANPGLFPSGTPAAGITFTEIMYNPASATSGDELPWEWVEIFNNTGATIDFSSGWVFDDNDQAALTAANITSGVIPNGTGAILFNGSPTGVTIATMQAAWDQGQNPNFIPVTNWATDLAQGGDNLGLWPSLTAYTTEASTAQTTRTFANTVATVNYSDEVLPNVANSTGTWTADDGRGSISMIDFGGGQSVGENWVLSVEGQGSNITANAISGTITVHAGGEIGTPGVFTVATATDADFDNDNDVDGNDFLIWQRGLNSGNSNATGDADGSGTVTAADLAIWKSKFGGPPAVAAAGAIPEPGTAVLAGLVASVCGLAGRRNRALAAK